MRFPVMMLFSFVVLGGMCLWIYFGLTSVTNEDIEQYRSLSKTSDQKTSNKEELQSYISTQQHRTTHKDIWFTQSDQRLLLRLRSKDTELVLEHHDNSTEVVEHMHGVTCFIQEELFYLMPDGREVVKKFDGSYVLRRRNAKAPEPIVVTDTRALKPMQILRYLQADHASYYSHSDRFNAEQVQVSQVIMPGHELKEALFGAKTVMTGVARSVEFSISGKDLNFTAYQLNATLHGSGGKKL